MLVTLTKLSELVKLGYHFLQCVHCTPTTSMTADMTDCLRYDTEPHPRVQHFLKRPVTYLTCSQEVYSSSLQKEKQIHRHRGDRAGPSRTRTTCSPGTPWRTSPAHDAQLLKQDNVSGGHVRLESKASVWARGGMEAKEEEDKRTLVFFTGLTSLDAWGDRAREERTGGDTAPSRPGQGAAAAGRLTRGAAPAPEQLQT